MKGKHQLKRPAPTWKINRRPRTRAVSNGSKCEHQLITWCRFAGGPSEDYNTKKFYISSKYLLPHQRRLRSFLGVTLKGDLVEEADGGLRSCPIPF